VASLRYDKLGSGQTGVGSYVDDPAAIGTGVYEQESAAALRFLAQQSQVDDAHLAVFGHSEGALFALLLATGAAGPVPKIHALGLIEPLSLRYLTLIAQQVDAQVTAQQGAGQISATVAAAVRAKLTAAVAQLRSKGTVAAGLPYGLANLLSPATAKFLSEADRDDPGVLASHLHTGTPVLVTCSDADVQVTCAEVAHVLTGLHHGGAAVDFVRLHGVDHVLKVDDSMGSAEYGSALAFSPQLHTALAAFVQQHLP